MRRLTMLLAALGLQMPLAHAQMQNEANNPLNPRPMISLHDYYVPELTSLDKSWANQAILRGVIPNKTFGLPQLWRFNLPMVSLHHDKIGTKSGVGDLTLMDIFMTSGDPVSYGLGPLLVIPTASNDWVGQGKWQIGTAAVAVSMQQWGIVGGLATFQQSFAGKSSRDKVRMATVQPVVFYNLPNEYYLRSSGVWTFDFQNHTHFIPVGLGVGKVIKGTGHKTINAFIEPQYSVKTKGVGVPKWQIFGGINFQF